MEVAKEAGEVDRAGLEGDHERREPRTGGEYLDPAAARRLRPLPREGVAVEGVNFAGKEGAAREEGQHQVSYCIFALSLQTIRAARPAGVV